MIRTVCQIVGQLSNKNPPRINEEGSNHRSPLTTGYRRKKMWGGTTVYPRLFGVNISSMFLLRTTNKIGDLWLIRLDSTTPTIGESCTLARSQQACSVTHRSRVSPTPKTLQIRNSIRTPTED